MEMYPPFNSSIKTLATAILASSLSFVFCSQSVSPTGCPLYKLASAPLFFQSCSALLDCHDSCLLTAFPAPTFLSSLPPTLPPDKSS